MFKTRFISMLVLLAAVATGAVAQTTYKVSVKEGTEDATSWTIAPAEATTTGVEAGTEVKATYGGTKKVKSVKAKKKAAACPFVNPVVGQIIGSDGKNYDANATLPDGVTAVAMIAYLGNGSDCTNGLAIQLNASPASVDNWSAACSYSSYPSITGNPGTWRLPSKDDWQNMFVGCAKEGDATSPDGDGKMNPIAGFKEKIDATGITWLSVNYWSSTGSGSNAWYLNVSVNKMGAIARFYEGSTSKSCKVLGCLAF